MTEIDALKDKIKMLENEIAIWKDREGRAVLALGRMVGEKYDLQREVGALQNALEGERVGEIK